MKQLVPLKKQSKKAQREHHAKQRGSWYGISPVTRTVPNGKAYDKSRETICRFNQKNVKASDFDIRMLSRTIYESARKFYEDPENVKAFEKWKAEKDKAKKSKK